MLKYLIIGILAVLIIVLIYKLFSNKDAKHRTKAQHCISRSSGGYDDEARDALRELTQINNPTAGDYFRRAHIARFNLLGNNLNNGTNELTNEVNPRATIINGIVTDYARAVATMPPGVLTIDDFDTAYMIHHIEEFGREADDMGHLDEFNRIVMQHFGAHLTSQRENIAKTRRAAAESTAQNRAESIAASLDSAKVYSSDSQNVHDTKVNEGLRKIYAKFRDHDIDPIESIDRATHYITTGDFSVNTGRNAIRTLNVLRQQNRISTFNDTDDRIFAYTWARCEHPKNAARRDLMRDAIVTALAESVENGKDVCTNGRCARILNSLALLDFDDSVSSVMTYEAYRNQIFESVGTIIDQEIERGKRSMPDEARDFEAGGDNCVQFKRNLRREIDQHIDSFSDKLSTNELNNIKTECYVYATVDDL